MPAAQPRRLTLVGRDPQRGDWGATRRSRDRHWIRARRQAVPAPGLHLCVSDPGWRRNTVKGAGGARDGKAAGGHRPRGGGAAPGPNEHYLPAESAVEFVAQIRRLEDDPGLRQRLGSRGPCTGGARVRLVRRGSAARLCLRRGGGGRPGGMVILHLLAPTTAGGLERVVHSLALGQQARGHHVEVAAVLDAEVDGHPFFPPLERAGVPVHRLIVPPRAYARERKAIASLVRTLAPDVVHSHGYRTDVVDGAVIRRLGVATVATAHGFTTGSWRNRLYEYLQRRALRRFDGVIAVSQQLCDALSRAGVSAARLHLVPNAWSQIVEPLDRAAARAALGLPAGGFVVGWVGRISREKGLDVLVDALPALGDLQLTVCAIGAGSERPAVEARARELAVGERMHWAGLVAEAARYFRAFDVFVLSSRTEGVPIALLEAIAADAPVVATRVGGVPTVVDETQALLVDPEQPAALAGAIRPVTTTAPLRLRVRAPRGRACRAGSARCLARTPRRGVPVSHAEQDRSSTAG